MPLHGDARDVFCATRAIATIVRLDGGRLARVDGSAARFLATGFELTGREVAVALLGAEGLPPASIAARLGMGEGTARNHMKVGFPQDRRPFPGRTGRDGREVPLGGVYGGDPLSCAFDEHRQCSGFDHAGRVMPPGSPALCRAASCSAASACRTSWTTPVATRSRRRQAPPRRGRTAGCTRRAPPWAKPPGKTLATLPRRRPTCGSEAITAMPTSAVVSTRSAAPPIDMSITEQGTSGRPDNEHAPASVGLNRGYARRSTSRPTSFPSPTIATPRIP